MYALKYWTPQCIDWKEFTIKCEQRVEWAEVESLTAEEYEDYNSYNFDPTELLESQELDLDALIMDLVSDKEWEKIKAKCYDIYDDCYEDGKKRLEEECDFNFYED